MNCAKGTAYRKNRVGICIPTYKRPEQLIQCVRSIITAAKLYNAPIFITDDSTDDTNIETIRLLSEEYNNIVYIRNEQNLGIDKNILKCIDSCSCEYAWPIGEDDRMIPGAIEVVNEIIERNNNDISFIFANYVYVNNEVTHITSEKRINIDADKKMAAYEFFEKYGWSTGFIGSCIINKSLWSACDSSKYVGTFFAHVGTIFESIYGKNVLITSDVLILNRAEDSSTFTWSEYAFEVNFGWDVLMTKLSNIYGDDHCHKAIESSRILFTHNTIRFLVSKRADAIYGLTNFRKYVLNSNHNILYKTIAFFVAIMPPWFFKAIKQRIYSKLKSRSSETEIGLLLSTEHVIQISSHAK